MYKTQTVVVHDLIGVEPLFLFGCLRGRNGMIIGGGAEKMS
jgi:hypothetical protein